MAKINVTRLCHIGMPVNDINRADALYVDGELLPKPETAWGMREEG